MKRRGFTLVELLVVLAVGSILLAIAIPSYAFLVNTNRLAAVTNDLVSALQLARSEAIKHGTRVAVCKTRDAMAVTPTCSTTANWQDGWLVFVDGGTRGQIAASTIDPGSNFSRFVSYRASGDSQGSGNFPNGKLHICLASNQRDIIINSTGRIRLESVVC